MHHNAKVITIFTHFLLSYFLVVFIVVQDVESLFLLRDVHCAGPIQIKVEEITVDSVMHLSTQCALPDAEVRYQCHVYK